MSSIPNYQQPSVDPTRTSKAAITSLIFGIIFCIPVISPVIAITAGLVGLSKTKQPGVKGRGLAITGIILGFVGILFTIGVLAVAGLGVLGFRKGSGALATFRTAVAEGQQGVATTTGLMNDLAAGNVDSAIARCTSNVSRDDLTKIRDALADMGTFHGANIEKTSFNQTTSGLQGDFGGKLNFEKGVKDFEVHIVTDAGAVKVDSVTVAP